MDVIIMAGGLAQRLGLGEKSCIDLNGKPLISYVIDALSSAEKIGRIFVSVTKATPQTKELILKNYPEITVIETAEGNYVHDMIYSVRALNTTEAVMVIMCDLPLLEPEIIDGIVTAYENCSEPALSTYVPISVCRQLGIRPDTVFHKNGKLIVPTGVNILDAKEIDHEQPDFNYIVDDERLAMNVNTAAELEMCLKIMRDREAGGDGK